MRLVAPIVLGGIVVGLVATGIEVVEVELAEGVVTGLVLLEPHPPSATTKAATPTGTPNETNRPRPPLRPITVPPVFAQVTG